MAKTGTMAWLSVRAGQDHLEQFARRAPLDALAELIWNSLDAEADSVDVDIDVSSIAGGSRDLFHVTRITISDNGHGITPDQATEAFPSLGDSWKKSLSGRTLNGLRPLHGSRGRGRFFAYSLGHHVRWSSIAETDDGLRKVEIEGHRARINGFTISLPQPTEGRPGTTVTITVEQGRPLPSLTRGDVPVHLAARLAPHLLGNPDITVRVNGQRVDPTPLIEGGPVEVTLDDVPPEDLEGREVPVMTIVDWTEEMRAAPGVVLCNENGTSLIEARDSVPPGTVRSTGYLRWSGWDQAAADLAFSHIRHPSIVNAGIETLARHVAQRTQELKATIVTILKDEDSYPYHDEIADPVQETERQLFDLLAVTARLRHAGRQQRAVIAGLLHIALQERPEELDIILAHALSLSQAERQELAELLRFSSLGAIVGAASEVSRRLDLLQALRHFVYSPGVSAEMREVDQLHPLVTGNAWLFGEAWRLSASEAGLTNVLRAVVGDGVALEEDLVREGDSLHLPEGKRGRVDLLLQRTLIGPNDGQDRLVVELKRPSVRLGDKELTQIRRYARALAGHPGVGPSRWTFWLVGSEPHEDIKGELKQQDREWGHISKAENYDIRVTTWGRLIDQAERRFSFYREQLSYSASQEEAVQRVRQRHRELLPPGDSLSAEPE